MRNLSMMTDLYQLTMMYGYYRENKHERLAVFDGFYRTAPHNGGFAIAAGLEQAIEYINNLKFNDEDIAYLRSLNLFDEDFLKFVKNFKFTGEIYALPEGTVFFPKEPFIRVKAPIYQAQLVETALLCIINHQTLIASKAMRVCTAACGDSVLEFGLRRAQGPDAGIYGARATIVGGCDFTSNVLMGEMYDQPTKGTHAHSWVMAFPSELEAFRAYARVFPSSCMLLVDTYDTLKSGVPNAIKVFDELKEQGYTPVGIRLDSGDLAYLSKQARKMLDEAGHTEAKIFASSDLDEYTIADLKMQGAKIDVWGVGTRMITGGDCPSLGGVYKLAAVEEDGVLQPRMKLSDNIEKVTNPGVKNVLRLYGKNGYSLADLIALEDEEIDTAKELTIYDPISTWKQTQISDFSIKKLLVPVFVDGKQVYESPDLISIREYCKKEMGTFFDEYKRLIRPHRYKVDLSDKLYDLKKELTREFKKRG